MDTVLCIETVEAYLDISRYWLKDAAGQPKTVNSVYEDIKGTPNEVGRNTLRLALEGKLDRGYFSNQVKLARLCSEWSGRKVTLNDIVRVEE